MCCNGLDLGTNQRTVSEVSGPMRGQYPRYLDQSEDSIRGIWTNGRAPACLVARRTDTLEAVVERDTDPVMLTGHGETVVHQESVQHQTVLNINIVRSTSE